MLVEAASVGLEPAAILIREIVRGTLGGQAAVEMVTGMYSGIYLDASGEPRDRPLSGTINDLFSIQATTDFRPAVDSLQGRLAGHHQSYLLLPNWNEPRARLEFATELSGTGGRQLVAILHGDGPLTQDLRAGDPRTLQVLAGGGLATVGELREILADYFRVPARQINTNLTRTERVAFDEIIGLVDWGPNTRARMR
jgi:hypothetical protein